MFLHVSVILFTGRCLPHSPLPAVTPPGQTFPPPRQIPPWADTPQADTLWADTPWADTTWADNPPGQTPPCPVHVWITPPRPVHAGIRSTSGRYASHWNAFLLWILKLKHVEVVSSHLVINHHLFLLHGSFTITSRAVASSHPKIFVSKKFFTEDFSKGIWKVLILVNGFKAIIQSNRFKWNANFGLFQISVVFAKRKLAVDLQHLWSPCIGGPVQKGHHAWMLVIGVPCLNVSSAERSLHLNVGYW